MSHLVRSLKPPPHRSQPKCLVSLGNPIIYADSWETFHSHPESPSPNPNAYHNTKLGQRPFAVPPFQKPNSNRQMWWPDLELNFEILINTYLFVSFVVVVFFTLCVNTLLSIRFKLLTLTHFSLNLDLIMYLSIVCHGPAYSDHRSRSLCVTHETAVSPSAGQPADTWLATTPHGPWTWAVNVFYFVAYL